MSATGPAGDAGWSRHQDGRKKESAMTITLTPSQIAAAKKVGAAIARDVLAEKSMDMDWTGIDAQDGDILTAAIDANSDAWGEAEEVAHATYDETIVAAAKIDIDHAEKIIPRSIKDGHMTVSEWAGVTDYEEVEDCLVLRPSTWYADDGNAEVAGEFDSGAEAAQDYVSSGDWGEDGGSISVCAWRIGIDADGDSVPVDEDSHEVDIEPDHDALIRAAGGDADCDHDWTAEGEGGCDENPGVWSTGGTSMVFHTHCKKCGLHRVERSTGPQHNPGEHDTVEYTQPENWCVECQSEECECDTDAE